MENEVRDRAGGPRGRRAARCHEVKIFCPRDVYEHVRAEIGPPIDDGRDPSDRGDPARYAGGLVHLAHLGGRRERASSKAAPTIWVAQVDLRGCKARFSDARGQLSVPLGLRRRDIATPQNLGASFV